VIQRVWQFEKHFFSGNKVYLLKVCFQQDLQLPEVQFLPLPTIRDHPGQVLGFSTGDTAGKKAPDMILSDRVASPPSMHRQVQDSHCGDRDE
jgi:hypothetical protein